jgi:hypothetical protein
MGDRIDITRADDHIFGLVVMNDWSGTSTAKLDHCCYFRYLQRMLLYSP